MLINSPHNPTGAVMTRHEVEAVAELCRRHDLWLISDEVYASLLYEGEHVAPAACRAWPSGPSRSRACRSRMR